MAGKLIVIDGVDGSGKKTQAELLQKRLKEINSDVLKIEFPNYSEDSSALIKMYLNGEFGKNPNDVNAYAASLFYAVDRYASYKKHWEADYLQGKIIIADRYVTSNAIHQAVKVAQSERSAYLDWLNELEYNKLKLPKPDLVLFLDMPPSKSQELIMQRYNNDNEKKDIHEKDNDYLKDCYLSASFACEKFGWTRIFCTDKGEIKSIEEISNEVLSKVLEVI